jgi:UDP-glucuronate decarboxylase
MSRIVDEDVEVILSEPLPWERFAGRSVLVTGATGMLGQYLVRTLLALRPSGGRPRVIALARNEQLARATFSRQLADPRLELRTQDVTAPISMDEELGYVVHAASPANPRAFLDDPVGVIAANVRGTEQLLALAAARQAVFCFISSMEVYGTPPAPGRPEVLVSESTPGVLDSLNQRSAYPESKRLAENLCVAYQAQYGVAYRIARLSHTYGPGMRLDDPRVQTYFMSQAMAGRDIVLASAGNLTRTYTYVSDAVSALFHLLCSSENGARNIADERAKVSIRELAEAVVRNAPTQTSAVVVPQGGRPGDPPPQPSVLLDCAALRAMGWRARVDLDAGLARTMRHHALESGSGR